MMKILANAMVTVMKTVAIVKYDKLNKETLIVTLDGNSQVIAQKPFKVISYWCLENGSSIQGRIDAFRYALNARQKCCIYVNDYTLLMPTTSLSNDDCIYINYHALYSYHQVDQQRTSLIFFNGQKEIINFNYRIINKQFKRSKAYLQYLEEKRRNFQQWIF